MVQNVAFTMEVALLVFLAFVLRKQRQVHGALLMSTALMFMVIALVGSTHHPLAGTYDVPTLGAVTITADPEGLGVRVGGSVRFALFPVSDEVFYVPGLDDFVAFSGGHPPSTLHIRARPLDVAGRRR